MTGRDKGIVLGILDAIAITIAWAVLPNRDPEWFSHGDYAGIVIAMGVCAGIPVAAIVGVYIGRMAERSHRTRVRSIVTFSLGASCIALLPALVLHAALREPTLFQLMSRALAATAVAALVLERWTRPALPSATAAWHRR